MQERTGKPTPAVGSDRAVTEAPGPEFTAGRDRFICRLESDVNGLERQLNDMLQRAARGDQVEDVREELKRPAAGDFRGFETWTQNTQSRLDRRSDRIEGSIENLSYYRRVSC